MSTDLKNQGAPDSHSTLGVWFGALTILFWLGLLLTGALLLMGLLRFGLQSKALLPGALLSIVLLTASLAGLFHYVRHHFRLLLFTLASLGTLLALAYAVEDWRGWRAWNSCRQALEAKGEPLSKKAVVPAPVPDEQNLAMAPLLKPLFALHYDPTGKVVWENEAGLRRLDSFSANLRAGYLNNWVVGDVQKGTWTDLEACAAFYRGNTNYPQAPAEATASQQIETALGRFAPELQELRQAAATRPLARFPITYEHEPAWTILLPHLSHLKMISTLLQLQATVDLANKRSSQALENAQLIQRLSDSIRQEPLLIDHLVRGATLMDELQVLREGIARHAWSEPQLSEWETRLNTINLLAEYKQAMRGERAFCCIGELDWLRRTKIADSLNFHLPAQTPRWLLFDKYSRHLIPSGWFYQNMACAALNFQPLLDAVEEKDQRLNVDLITRTEENISASRLGPYTVAAKPLLSGLTRSSARAAESQTYVEAARVACALERYRLVHAELPASLQALVPQFLAAVPKDIIDGQLLRYHPEPNGGYRLYSVGWNQKDDGGMRLLKEETPAHPKQGSNLQGDWVWSMERISF